LGGTGPAVLGVAGPPLRLGSAGLGGLHPLAGLPDERLLTLDGGGDPLDELVDVLGVVAAALRLAELGIMQDLRGQFHALDGTHAPSRLMVESAPFRNCVTPPGGRLLVVGRRPVAVNTRSTPSAAAGR